MGWLTSALKVVKPLARGVPLLGTAIAAYEVGGAVLGAARSAGAGMVPPASSGFPGLPALPGVMGSSRGQMVPTPGQTGGFGLPRGPGGRLQLPTSDPHIIEALKPFALDDSFLKLAVRAPRGYVVVRDTQGRPFAVLKTAARHFRVWKPAKKPPISVGEWHAVQRADRAVKKVRKIMTTMVRVDKAISHGKVKIHSHKKGGK